MDSLTHKSRVSWAWIREALHDLPNTFGLKIGEPRTVILRDIAGERVRQLDKWGEQTHPCTPADALDSLGDKIRALMERQMASELERAARDDCQRNFKLGRGTWWAIAWEELAEAGGAPDLKARREELIQTAAVLVAWIEDIDKKLKDKP